MDCDSGFVDNVSIMPDSDLDSSVDVAHSVFKQICDGEFYPQFVEVEED